MPIHIQILHSGLLRTKPFFLQTVPSGTTVLDMGYAETGEAAGHTARSPPEKVIGPVL